MKLYSLIETGLYKDYPEKLVELIDKKLDWLRIREPENEGYLYDLWEEKCDELEYIIDCFDKTKDVDALYENVVDYQLIYGGLKNWDA